MRVQSRRERYITDTTKAAAAQATGTRYFLFFARAITSKRTIFSTVLHESGTYCDFAAKYVAEF